MEGLLRQQGIESLEETDEGGMWTRTGVKGQSALSWRGGVELPERAGGGVGVASSWCLAFLQLRRHLALPGSQSAVLLGCALLSVSFPQRGTEATGKGKAR